MSDNHDNHLPGDAAPVDPREEPARSSDVSAEASRRSRRSLIRAGLAAVPIVLTLRSRPARADIQFASNPDEPFYITGHSPDDQPTVPGGQAPDWLRTSEQEPEQDWSTSSDWSGGSFLQDDPGETQF